MKTPLFSLGLLAIATLTTQAALISWNGGSGDWDTATNWDSGTVPKIGGKDNVLVDSGTVTRSGNLDFKGGSYLTLTGNSALTVTGNFYVRNGAVITVESGSTLTITGGTNNAFYTYGGGVFDLKGTLIANGASSNSIKAPSGLGTGAVGGFNFTATGAKMQFDNFTGANLQTYLEGKAAVDGGAHSFFKIDGTQVFGFGSANAVNGKYLEFSGSSTVGSLTLVPEPSSAALLGLGGLALLLRRRK